MSVVTSDSAPAAPAPFRYERWAPVILLGAIVLLYIIIAIATGQSQ